MINTPEFLFGVEVSPTDEILLEKVCRNWLTTNEFFVMEKEKVTMALVQKMMLFELRGKRRVQLLTKMHGKLLTTRRDLERGELLEMGLDLAAANA